MAKARKTEIKPKSETTKGSPKLESAIEAPSIPIPEVQDFTRRFIGQIQAGLPLVPALAAAGKEQPNPQLRIIAEEMVKQIESGQTFFEAVSGFPTVFSRPYRMAIMRGEETGTMDTALELLLGQPAELWQPWTAQGFSDHPDHPPISATEIGEFTHDFATLVSEGTSLVRTLTALEEKQTNPEFKRVLGELNVTLQQGYTLSQAMKAYPEIFDEAYTRTIRAGEENGVLDQMLQSLARRDDILTFDQAVQFLGTSKATLYRLLSQGTINGLKVGRQWRFRRADLVAYMERKPETVTLAAGSDLEIEREFFSQKLREAGIEWSKAKTAANEEDRVIKLVNGILALAIQEEVSDIHLEATSQDVLLRFRIDGVLHEVRRMPRRLHALLIQRLKVMSECNPEEKTVPQDGRLLLKYNDQKFDLRVGICPAAYGESIVMRITAQSHALLTPEQLGLTDENRSQLAEWLNRPHGLIILAGPAGSGSTTTLYSLLHTKLSPEIKTMTIEDPVEYALPYATQVHVNRSAGLLYANALRAFLRQDPDIIVCSEGRDAEILGLLHRAALAGHLTLTIMQVASGLQVVQQLTSLGIEPFLVTSTLIGTVSQNLVRRICTACREEYAPSPALVARLRELAAAGGYVLPKKSVFYRGTGCDKCRQSGYKGRIGLFELMEITPTLAEAILRHDTAEELTRIMIDDGTKSLIADGARKALAGETTIDEIFRIAAISLA